MRSRSIILSIMAAVLVFGTMIAGCKRDSRTAMNTGRKPQPRQQRGRETVRPAEVLSASARRPPRIEGTASIAYAQPAAPVQTAYVLPPPSAGPVYTAPASYQNVSYATYYPEYAGYTGYAAPQPVNTPELAMAKASLPPQPAVYQPQPAPRALPPIPELEPVRHRLPAAHTGTRPAAEIMMSAGTDSREIQRALAPIPADTAAGWVSSPATAMRF